MAPVSSGARSAGRSRATKDTHDLELDGHAGRERQAASGVSVFRAREGEIAAAPARAAAQCPLPRDARCPSPVARHPTDTRAPTHKINADRADVALGVGVVLPVRTPEDRIASARPCQTRAEKPGRARVRHSHRKAEEQAGLANARVSDQEELEQVITAPCQRAFSRHARFGSVPRGASACVEGGGPNTYYSGFMIAADGATK